MKPVLTRQASANESMLIEAGGLDCTNIERGCQRDKLVVDFSVAVVVKTAGQAMMCGAYATSNFE